MLDLYKLKLDLIEKKAGYLLSTRSAIAIYKGNLGRPYCPAGKNGNLATLSKFLHATSSSSQLLLRMQT